MIILAKLEFRMGIYRKSFTSYIGLEMFSSSNKIAQVLRYLLHNGLSEEGAMPLAVFFKAFTRIVHRARGILETCACV